MYPKIHKEEFYDRIEKAKKMMNEQNIDLLFCFGNETEPQFVRYFSDYAPLFESAAVLIPLKGEPLLIIGPESETLAKEFSVIKNIKRVLEFRESSEPEYPDAQLDTFDSIFNNYSFLNGNLNIGLAGYNLITNSIYKNFESSLNKIGNTRILKSDQLVLELRKYKSKNEIACMQKAYDILKYAFEEILNEIKVGMSENEIKGIALKAIYEKGAESEGYPFWILVGEGSNKAVGKIRNKKIKNGDLIHIQLGARYEGYVASLGRAIVAGKPSQYQIDLVNAGLKVQEEIIKNANVGVNAKYISELHRNVLTELGFADHILYGPCHSTGLMENEAPWIESDSDFLLEDGMTFCTCLYLGNDEKKIGMRIEDGFYIKEGKAVPFATHNHKLIQI